MTLIIILGYRMKRYETLTRSKIRKNAIFATPIMIKCVEIFIP